MKIAPDKPKDFERPIFLFIVLVGIMVLADIMGWL